MRALRIVLFAHVLWATLGSTDVLAQATGDMPARARELAELRAEVDRLDAEVRAARDQERRSLSTLAAQRDEVAVLLRRERARVTELRSRLAEVESARAEAAADGGDLRQSVLAAADELIVTVEGGLPFRLDDRVGALRTLRTDVAGGRLSPENAASRLWQFMEDEIRLARDVGVYRDVVMLEGRRELVEVAKIGMFALYVRAADGRIAHAVSRDGGFHFELLTAPGSVRAVQKLFDALDRQIRSGEHELPIGRTVR